MSRHPFFLTWKLSVAESLAFAATAVTITLWVMATFVEKTSAREFSDQVEARFMQTDARHLRVEGKIDKIEDDVAVIRGILEAQRQERRNNRSQQER